MSTTQNILVHVREHGPNIVSVMTTTGRYIATGQSKRQALAQLRKRLPPHLKKRSPKLIHIKPRYKVEEHDRPRPAHPSEL